MEKSKNSDTAGLIKVLTERWPACFAVYERRRQPLKIRIRNDILAALDIVPRELKSAPRYYSANSGYAWKANS